MVYERAGRTIFLAIYGEILVSIYGECRDSLFHEMSMHIPSNLNRGSLWKHNLSTPAVTILNLNFNRQIIIFCDDCNDQRQLKVCSVYLAAATCMLSTPPKGELDR
jgi:hypothetical protein